jgi:hypothetical protein
MINFFSSKSIESIEQLASVRERFKKDYPKEMDLAFKDHDQLFATYGGYICGGSSIKNILILLQLLSENKFF